MTIDIILGIVRHVLTIGAGILVTKGTIDNSQAEQGVAAVLGLAGVIWSIFHKTTIPTAK